MSTKCGVCLDPIENQAIELEPCADYAHPACYAQWCYDPARAAKCPTCSRAITGKRATHLAAIAAARECPICYDLLAATPENHIVQIDGCGHVYHNSCLADWAESGGTRCPSCNAENYTISVIKLPQALGERDTIIEALALGSRDVGQPLASPPPAGLSPACPPPARPPPARPPPVIPPASGGIADALAAKALVETRYRSADAPAIRDLVASRDRPVGGIADALAAKALVETRYRSADAPAIRDLVTSRDRPVGGIADALAARALVESLRRTRARESITRDAQQIGQAASLGRRAAMTHTDEGSPGAVARAGSPEGRPVEGCSQRAWGAARPETKAGPKKRPEALPSRPPEPKTAHPYELGDEVMAMYGFTSDDLTGVPSLDQKG